MIAPLVAALLAAGPATAETGLGDAQVAAVEKAVAEMMSASGAPGLSVAIALDGEVRYAKGFGYADVENQVAAGADTVYRLASISKPITAVAALQLAEAGRLDLDADVRRYVPGFPPKPWPITTRLLLAHLGGVRHYQEGEFGHDPASGEAFGENTRRFASLLEGLDVFKDDPLVAEPGTRFNYTTHGYTLIGCVVEAVSKERFVAYLGRHIFTPAGMTGIRDDEAAALIPHRALGYRKTADGQLRNSDLSDTSYKIPGGGLVATASDLARFASALLDGRLLRSETVTKAFTRQVTKTGRAIGYGLGWDVAERNGRREIWHTGGQARVSNVLYLRPDRRLAIAILTNLERSGPKPLAQKIADLVRP